MSIPIFTGKLNEARQNTDKANIRAAKAAAITYYLSEEGKTTSAPTYYDIKEGKMVTNPPAPYNKVKQKAADGTELAADTAVVQVTYGTDFADGKGTVTANWVTSTTQEPSE